MQIGGINMTIQVLKISGSSNVNVVAGKIFEYVTEQSVIHIDTIGINATYTGIKSIIKAVEYLVKNGYRFNLRPYYTNVDVAGQDEYKDIKTAIRWTLIAKQK